MNTGLTIVPTLQRPVVFSALSGGFRHPPFVGENLTRSLPANARVGRCDRLCSAGPLAIICFANSSTLERPGCVPTLERGNDQAIRSHKYKKHLTNADQVPRLGVGREASVTPA